MDNYRNIRKYKIQEAIKKTTVMVTVAVVLSILVVNGVNKHIENQDIMLCQSAKVSGNINYLDKCQCYYQSGDITCLQK